MIVSNRLFAAPAMLAALSLTAVPASAAAPPAARSGSALAQAQAWQAAAPSAEDYRPWRGHRRHRDGDAVGGLLAGALLIGGIAAVASAATRDTRRVDYRVPPPPPPYHPAPYAAPYAAPYPAERADYAGAAARVCISAVEHEARVDGGLTVDRRDFGFTVRGRFIEGPSFTCDVTRDGQIRRLTYDGADDRQGYMTPPPAEPYGMSEDQRADRDSRLNGTEHEVAPAYPDVTEDRAKGEEPGQGVDTRPEYPGDLPQTHAGDEAPQASEPAPSQDDSDDGDLDPQRMQAAPAPGSSI